MVPQDKAVQYLEAKVLTATKEELLIMLFDGAIKFAECAKVKIDEKDVEGSCKFLIKAQRIIAELMASLRKDLISEELYSNLIGLYKFVYLRLIKANMTKDKDLIDESLAILRMMRETWQLAIEKAKEEQQNVRRPQDSPKNGLTFSA
jgi:flagellar protein FliS